MAANTNVKVTITGDSSGAEKAFKSATAQARAMQKQLDATNEVMSGAGRAMMAGGALMAAGLGLAARAAIQWESAFAGVRKTTDTTGLSAAQAEQEFARLDAGLRDMAKNLPASHRELAAVAEAAGQLGVKRQDVLGFTKVMVDLGETTNLSADEAATALARFMNIMGTTSTDVSRLGASLVALGNDGASTEAEITDMALRIAGAGKQIGLTESEVLSFSNALSSVGIEAEAGGTAFSTAMVRIDKAVRTGGESLAGFAEVAGMTSEEFARAYRDDAAGAVVTFVEGLGQIQTSGGDAFGTLENLGLTGVRLQDALLRSAGAGDLLRESIVTGNEAWNENTALLAEAEQRYGTTEAKMQIARNAINDTAITIGQQMLPMLGNLAEDVATLSEWFGDLPEPVQHAGTQLGIAAAALGLFGGAALTTLPKLQALQASLALMGPAGARAATGVRALTGALGPIALALTALTLVGGAALNGWINQKQAVDDYASSLDSATGATTEATRALAAKTLQDAGALENARILGLELSTITDAALGNADALDEVRAAQERVNTTTLTNQEINEGGLNALAERKQAAEDLLNIIDRESTTLQQAQADQQELAAATAETGAVQDETATSTEALTEAVGATASSAEDAEQAMSDLRDTLQMLLVDTFSVEAAQDALESQIISMSEAVKQATDAGDGNAKSLQGNSAAALANREALRGMTEQAGQVIEKMIEQGATSQDVAAETARLKGRIDEAGAAAGFAAEDVSRYSGQLDNVPTTVSTTIQTNGLAEGERRLSEFVTMLQRFNGSVYTTTIRTVRQDGGVSIMRGPEMRAEGGPIQRGKPYIVGEEGPELIVAPDDGYVLNARQSAAVIGKGYEVPQPLAMGAPSMQSGGGGGAVGTLLNIERIEAGLSRREWVEVTRAAADEANRQMLRGVTRR